MPYSGFRKTVIIFMMTTAACIAYGQQNIDSGFNPLEIELRKHTDLILGSGSPSMYGFEGDLTYSDISLYSEYTAGTLLRPQQGNNILSVNFDAAGAKRLGKFFLDGGFRFRQKYEDGVKFASTFNPLRDNPYFIADSTGGDWTKQSYDLWANVAFDAVPSRLSAGLGAEISVGRGAKKIDPRPQANTNTITFLPSLAYNAGRIGIFSVSMVCALYKETANFILYDSSQPQKLYLMKGMGQYTYEVFSNTERERKYEGNDLGIRAAYLYRKGHTSISLSCSWTNSFETAFDMDYNKPHLRGRLYTDRYSAALRIASSRSRTSHRFSLEYSGKSISGREIVQIFDSSPDINSWVTDSEIPGRYVKSCTDASASYILWLKRAEKTTWRFAAGLGYGNVNERYDAMSSFMYGNSVIPSVDIYKVFYVGKGFIRTGVQFSARFNTDRGMAYVCREDDDTIRTGLIEPDYRILSSDIAGAGISLAYSLRLKNMRSITVKASGRYYSTVGQENILELYGASAGLTYSF